MLHFLSCCITNAKVGFYPGNLRERLARGTKQTTALVVRCEHLVDYVIHVSQLIKRHL